MVRCNDGVLLPHVSKAAVIRSRSRRTYEQESISAAANISWNLEPKPSDDSGKKRLLHGIYQIMSVSLMLQSIIAEQNCFYARTDRHSKLARQSRREGRRTERAGLVVR